MRDVNAKTPRMEPRNKTLLLQPWRLPLALLASWRSLHLRSELLILPRRKRFLRLFLREHTFLHVSPLGHFLTRSDGFHQIKQLRPNQRIALDGAVQLAIRHRFEGGFHAV